MMERRYAIITGADGGMGREITRAVAAAGYYVIMACYNPSAAEPVRQRIADWLPFHRHGWHWKF